MTINELKNRVNKGEVILLEMVERYGETGEAIPERLRGKRRILTAHSYGFRVQHDYTKREHSHIKVADSEVSRFEVKASDCKITDTTLEVANSNGEVYLKYNLYFGGNE